MFIYKKNYERKKSSRYHFCSNVWNSEDSNALSIKLLDFLLNSFYRCVDLGKKFKNEIYLFSFGQNGWKHEIKN